MRLVIRQKNLELTPSLKEYIELKLARPLARMFPAATSRTEPFLEVEVGRSTRHHLKGAVFYAEVMVRRDGATIRAEAEAEDVRMAIDIAKETVEEEITHERTRSQSLFKRFGRRVKQMLRFDPAAWRNAKGRVRDEGR